MSLNLGLLERYEFRLLSMAVRTPRGEMVPRGSVRYTYDGLSLRRSSPVRSAKFADHRKFNRFQLDLLERSSSTIVNRGP